MSLFVVDASVGLKWLIPEPGTPDALRLRNSGHALHIPTLFDVEIGNILWKKVRQNVVPRLQADQLLAQLPGLPLIRHSDGHLLANAFDLANRTGRTVYDCLYLALAVQLRGKMVTADERFVNSLAATIWAGSIARVQDVP